MKRIRLTAALLALLLCSCTEIPADTEITGDAENTTTVTVTEPEADMTKEQRYELSDEGNRYYFSADGDDSADGKTAETAKKSLSFCDSLTLSPGDRILLRRGDVWHERLNVRGKGSAEAPVYVGSYGDGGLPAPRISLSCERDDIAILCEDPGTGLGHIIFDGVTVSDSHQGVYIRSTGGDNGNIAFYNCAFININCPELMTEALTDISWLGKPRAGLSGGGAYEYVWPAAVNVGGRPALPLSSVDLPGKCAPTTVFSCVTVEDCVFDGCVIAVGANCYNYHYGTGDHQFRAYTKNWRIKNVVCRNTMTALNFDSCDFGYDGTEDSEWGVFENIIYDGGMEGFTMAYGTTAALLSSCQNLYVRNSRFGGCKNGGYPDGCGFDFERDDHNVTLDHCVIDNNDGQGVLIMDTVMTDQVTGEQVHTPSTDCVIKNCVFYGNMKNVYNENYNFDILVFNRENEGISVSGCSFYYAEKTSGGASVRINRRGGKDSPAGQITRGVTLTDNEMHKYENRADFPAIDTITAGYLLSSAL